MIAVKIVLLRVTSLSLLRLISCSAKVELRLLLLDASDEKILSQALSASISASTTFG